MRCWSRQLTGGAPEHLEMHHSAVFDVAPLTLNMAHEALIFDNLPQLVQVRIFIL